LHLGITFQNQQSEKTFGNRDKFKNPKNFREGGALDILAVAASHIVAANCAALVPPWTAAVREASPLICGIFRDSAAVVAAQNHQGWPPRP
jgi:hypothetical protein